MYLYHWRFYLPSLSLIKDVGEASKQQAILIHSWMARCIKNEIRLKADRIWELMVILVLALWGELPYQKERKKASKGEVGKKILPLRRELRLTYVEDEGVEV